MRRIVSGFGLMLALVFSHPGISRGAPHVVHHATRRVAVSEIRDPASACVAAMAAAARSHGVPGELLAAIGRVESGRRDPATGAVRPWPWTVNVNGQSYYFAAKDQAVDAVRIMQADGIQSVDVGCGQISLMYHPDAFPNLEAAFDPEVNARFAAHFLHTLYVQTGDWPRAAAMYHSATPALGATYLRKVLAVLPGGQGLPVAADKNALEASLARAWGTGTLRSSALGNAASALSGSGWRPGMPVLEMTWRGPQETGAARFRPVSHQARHTREKHHPLERTRLTAAW